MTLSLEDQGTLAVNGVFISRVRQAMLTEGTDVQAEDPETFNHDARIELARNTTRSPNQTAKVATFTLSTTSTLNNPGGDPIDDAFAENISDAAYVATVASRWNDMTGVSTFVEP